MKTTLKVTPLWLVIGIILLIFFRLYLFKAIFLLVLPGFCILALLSRMSFEKKLLFSVPLSMMIFIYPYFLITRTGIAIQPHLYFLLIPLALLALCLKKKVFSIEYSKSFNLQTAIFGLTLLTIFFIIYNPYSFKEALPLTAGSNDFFTALRIYDQTLEKGVISTWSSSLYSGNHDFYTYPPLAKITLVSLWLLPTESLGMTYNLTILFLYGFMLYATYCLLRFLKLGSNASLLGTCLMIAVPHLAGEVTFSGNFTSPFMYALAPVAIYAMLSIFNDKPHSSIKAVLLYACAINAFALSYHYNAYFLLLAGALACITGLLINKNKKITIRNLMLLLLFTLGFFLSWFVRYIEATPFVILVGWEGNWNTPLSSINEFLKYIAQDTSDDMLTSIFTFSSLFFYLGLVSSILLIRRNKEKTFIERSDLITLVFTLSLLFLFIVEIFPFHTLIPLRNNYYKVFRYFGTILPFFAFGIARLYETLNNYLSQKLKSKYLGVITYFVFILIFSQVIITSANNVFSWLSEEAVIKQENFNSLYDLLKTGPDGRVIIFGSFGPAINPAVSRWAERSLFAGYNFQRHATKLIYNHSVLPITDASSDYLKNVSAIYAFNTWQKSFTNNLVIFTCTEKGVNSYNEIIKLNNYSVLGQAECLGIINPIPLSNYAEEVVLSKVNESQNRDLVIQDIMNKEDGWKVVFTSDEKPEEYYTNIVNDDNISGLNLLTSPLFFNIRSDTEIIIQNPKQGFILVKEAFFPTWHAYQDGKELSVFPSYEGYSIIKSESEEEIIYKSMPLLSESLGLIIFIILLLPLAPFAYKSILSNRAKE